MCEAADLPTVVLTEYSPTEDYRWCKGKEFEKR